MTDKLNKECCNQDCNQGRSCCARKEDEGKKLFGGINPNTVLVIEWVVLIVCVGAIGFGYLK